MQTTISAMKEVATAVERHVKEDGLFETAVPGLALYRCSTPSEHDAVVYVPSLCVVVQGAKEVTVDGQTYSYDSAQSLLVSVDLPARGRVVEASPRRPCLVARIDLDAAVVGELLADGIAISASDGTARAIGLAPVEPPLVSAVARLVALLDAPRDIAALSPLIVREIVYRVLTGPQGARFRQIAMPGAPAHRIARALRWLKEHFTEPMRVDALAKRVGLSPSAFHLHFKAVTGLSPLQYQKQLRLQEARGLMMTESLEAAEAAYRVGYESPSQFGREYRRLFGASPRRSVDALQVAAQASR